MNGQRRVWAIACTLAMIVTVTALSIGARTPVPVAATAGILVEDMTLDAAGRLWLVGIDGAWRYDPAEERLEPMPIDGKTPYVRCIAAGANGEIWLGSDEDGAYRFDGRSFERCPDEADLRGSCVFDLAIGADGALWLGTDWGLTHVDNDACTSYGLEDGLPSRGVWAIALSPTGEPWLGTAEFGPYIGGAVVWRDGAWIRYGTEDGLPGNDVKEIAAMQDGTVWAATYYGLAHFDGASWTVEGQEGLSGVVVGALAVDREDAIWVATSSDVWCRPVGGTSWTLISAAPAWPTSIRAFAFEEDGTVWMAALGSSSTEPCIYVLPADETDD